jgi:hypothetical protein
VSEFRVGPPNTALANNKSAPGVSLVDDANRDGLAGPTSGQGEHTSALRPSGLISRNPGSHPGGQGATD